MRYNTAVRELPHMKKKMEAYRAGARSIPATYIDYHKSVAENELLSLAAAHNLRVHSTELIDDGWFDGMRVLRAVVETPKGSLLSLKYSDGNCSFMLRCPSGGHSFLGEKDLV